MSPIEIGDESMKNQLCIADIIAEIQNEVKSSYKSVAQQHLASTYYEKMMDEFKKQNEIVIVGSGVYGLRLYEMLEAEGMSLAVKCFCDNSRERQELKIHNLPILSVEDAVLRYPCAYYIITPKKYENELLRQLVHLGILVDNIAIYTFMHTGLVD